MTINVCTDCVTTTDEKVGSMDVAGDESTLVSLSCMRCGELVTKLVSIEAPTLRLVQ